LVQHRHERVDVPAFERIHVATHERALRFVRGPGVVGRAGLMGGERAACALQRAVDRGGAGAEQIGNLGGLPLQHFVQNQRRALACRQELQGGDESEPDGLASRELRGRIFAARKHQTVGDRLEPGRFVECRPECGVGRPCGPQVHRPGAPLTRTDHAQTDVGGDAVEPGADRGATLELVVAAPGADQRLLHRVLGLEGRAEHAVAVAGELNPVQLERHGELGRDGWGGVIACTCGRSAISASVGGGANRDIGARRESGIDRAVCIFGHGVSLVCVS